MLLQIVINEKLIKNFFGKHGQKWCGESGYGTLKLTVSKVNRWSELI